MRWFSVTLVWTCVKEVIDDGIRNGIEDCLCPGSPLLVPRQSSSPREAAQSCASSRAFPCF